ncbi:MAG: TonB-dependent receptor [Acidobacteria bacterium]|nr:TonB-dependent receptor [Acidobacteriota bacterium]
MARAQQEAGAGQVSLEDLAAVEVTTVARQPRRLSDSAAAVHVITRQDISRSGATSLPEVLRMVPGVHVARIDANRWAVSIRGFNHRHANKLLVLVDGRSIYTALFSGVVWEANDMRLDDIERIEVVRGPGATLWGANAVNGVINIITRSSSKTHGVDVSVATGSNETLSAGARVGGTLGSVGHYRAFGKYGTHEPFGTLDGHDGDSGRAARTGGRLDLFPSPADSISVSGEVYRGRFGAVTLYPEAVDEIPIPRVEFNVLSGGFVLGSWERAPSANERLTVRAYYDHSYRDESSAVEKRDTFDADIQHRVMVGRRHTLLWGANYRVSRDEVRGTETLTVDGPQRVTHFGSAFAQDDILLFGDAVRLTIGAKADGHSRVGIELLPNVRAAWMRGNQSIWGAVSRSVRTPSRAEFDLRAVPMVLPQGTLFSGAPLTTVVASGSDDLGIEELRAYEAGYRWRNQHLSIDVAAFVNDYDDLMVSVLRQSFVVGPPLRLVVPFEMENISGQRTYGVELAADLRVTRWLRLTGSWAEMRHGDYDESPATLYPELSDTFADRIASVVASASLPRRAALTSALHYASRLDDATGDVLKADVSFMVPLSSHVDVAIVGQNLLRASERQFRASVDRLIPTDVPRAIVVRSTVHF